MTTAADVLRVAEEVRAAGLIYRERSGYVSIQEQAPYDGANRRFPRGVKIEHCGVSVAWLLHRASSGSLRFGIDYPDWIQYSEYLANQILAGDYDQRPQPGAIGVIDWGAAGYGQTTYADHVVLEVRVDGDMILCWETNTTADGRAYYYWRHKSLFVAHGLPRYRTPPPPTPAASAIPALTAVIGATT